MTFRHDLNCEPKPLRITGILFGILEDFGRTGVTGGCSGDRASCRVGSVGEPRAESLTLLALTMYFGELVLLANR